MGYDFDTSGHYVGWSPYFNFNSIESLKASEMLPTPMVSYTHTEVVE